MRYVETSPTSFEAAVDNLPRSGTQRRQILDAIRAAGYHGLTRDELEIALDLSGNAVRPRVRELQDEGHIEEDPERTRRTRSGSQAAVLVVNVGGSTEESGRPRAEGLGDMAIPSEKTLGVASGVERPRTSSPSGGAPPAESLFDLPPAPSAFDPWERAA